MSVSPFGYLRCFKSDLDALISYLIEFLSYSSIVYPGLIYSPEGQEIQFSPWGHCRMVNIVTKMARMVGIVSMMVNIVTKICC